MHRMAAMMPPTPRLAVVEAEPVKVAKLGLTGDTLAPMVAVADGTGTTLTTFGTVMVEYVVVVLLEVVVGTMNVTGLKTCLIGATEAGVVTAVPIAETGQTVLYRTLVSVVTWPIFAGQFVTVSEQAVMVYVRVV
jgi:hypothetical protein